MRLRTLLLADAALSALLNVVLLAAIPFLVYFVYHKWRWKRGFKEIAERAGLRLGENRYIGYSLVFAFIAVGALVIHPPSLDVMVREGSAWRPFVGLGFGVPAVTMALLYGVVKTGFPEEFLFRGLIAGSLSRRLPFVWANLIQALIFLVPHLFLLFIMPEMWGLLVLVFAGSLFVGWVRMNSGSILGPWLVHACLNVAMGLSVAVRAAA